jgi:RNA polymerase sigma factor (sigma-70 family)
VPGESVRDEAWHDALFKAHWRGIMAMLERLLGGDVATAEDLAQKTFQTAWTRRHKIQDEPRGWLFAVARNHWLNHWRSNSRRRFVEYDHEVMGHLNPVPGADEFIETSGLDLADDLQGLSDLDREVLELRYFNRLDCNEIAEALRIPAATARKRLSRAEKKARALLAERMRPGAEGHSGQK